MKCFKCDKEMGREDGKFTIEGIHLEVHLADESPVEAEMESSIIGTNQRTPENIAYNNLQLGKYSDGNE